MEQITKIAEFILRSFLHIWPYLIVTIPLAVVINVTGASRYISTVLGKNQFLSVFLATLIGAFSPFCSCGVIPIITTLLIGGVPLAPVMSFWIASPSMDPEIFFLSGYVIGWKLAVWRLVSTFIISLLAGYVTALDSVKNYTGKDLIRRKKPRDNTFVYNIVINLVGSMFSGRRTKLQLLTGSQSGLNNSCCSLPVESNGENFHNSTIKEAYECNCEDPVKKEVDLHSRTILREIIKATLMVTRFMGIAFLITALINLYLPKDVISWIVNASPSIQVIMATIIGIPVYTSNITALPLVGGLIGLGLNKGAALSFLIAGATTTLPALTAVWGITSRKVFILYIMYVLSGALLAGFLLNLIG